MLFLYRLYKQDPNQAFASYGRQGNILHIEERQGKSSEDNPTIRDHSFCTYVTFSEKITLLTP